VIFMVCEDFAKSIKILGLSENYTEQQLKKSYYKKAIQFHPDKNPNGEEEFKKINAAYEFLKKEKNEETFEQMVERYIKIHYPLLNVEVIRKAINILIHKVKSKTENILETMTRDTAIEIYKVLSLLGINKEMEERMREIIRKKVGEIIILHPTIDNLLNDEIYKLDYHGECFYIPLWHQETVFDCSGKEIIVQCVPVADIDDHNNIYIDLERNVEDILSKGYVEFSISTKKFRIDATELKIVKKQTIVLYKKGIALENISDIYNCKERGNIYVTLVI
jgi:hypothetical protein